jgi:hypothetical protein
MWTSEKTSTRQLGDLTGVGLLEVRRRIIVPVTITLDTYSHVLPNMQDHAAAAMEEALS